MHNQGTTGQKERLLLRGKLPRVEWAKLTFYTAACSLKVSRVLLASNPAREGRISRFPGGSIRLRRFLAIKSQTILFALNRVKNDDQNLL
ncbi:MAG: hypothetical protein FJ267_06045 [Planctomycetes bacterium]|nr:hypothetical protein [Planctomycetota bacterium]